MELQPPVTQYIHYVIHTSEFLCDLNCKKIYSSVKHSTRYSKYYLQPLMFTRALIPEKKEVENNREETQFEQILHL